MPLLHHEMEVFSRSTTMLDESKLVLSENQLFSARAIFLTK